MTTLPTPTIPDTRHIEQRVSREVEQAKAFVVRDQATYLEAVSRAQRLKGFLKAVLELFRRPKALADHAHKSICQAEKALTGPLCEIIEAYTRHALAWHAEQERRRRAEEQRIAEEIRLKQEADAAAARARAEAERQEKIAEAERLEQMGFPEFAEQAIDEAAKIPDPAPVIPTAVQVVLPSEVPKVAGLSVRPQWSAKVVDLKALCRAVADGVVPEAYVLPALPVLNAQARALKSEFRCPGVEAICTTGAAVRAAKE